MIKRKELRFVGDKKYYFNGFFVILCLVGVTGISVLLTGLGVVLPYTSMLEPNVIQRMIINSSVAMAVILLASFVVSLLFMKKVAGPLHGLKLKLQRMLDDNSYTPISFRSDDEFKSVAELINSFCEKFIQRNNHGSKELSRMSKELKKFMHDKIGRGNGSIAKEELSDFFEEIHKDLNRLQNDLAK